MTAEGDDDSTTNPLLRDWSTQPFRLPPFSEIRTSDFEPALEVARKAHLEELQSIANTNKDDDDEEPTFENVIVAYVRAGSLLSRVSSVFSNLCSSMNTQELQAVQTKLSPLLSRHRSAAYTVPGLFDKIDAVYQQTRDASSSNNHKLSPEQIRLIERIHTDFVRQGGAQLSAESQHELAEIKAELATLRTEFLQNVLKDESDYGLAVTLDDLKGCPASLIEAAKQAAIERHNNDNNDDEEKEEKNDNVIEDEYIITLSRSLIEPFLVFCQNRKLRKTAWEAWTKRGELTTNNIPIATKILALRQKQAKLYGYKSFAEYQCVDRMAKTPKNVSTLLEDVWERAKVSANKERKELEDYVKEHGLFDNDDGDDDDKLTIQPWDWRFVAEKVRKAKYDFDESLLKPYLSLESVRSAMFAVSSKLFGLTYTPRPDVETYHPDVDAYEVRNANNRLVAVFLQDNYSRQFKSSGAWMSEYRSQTKNLNKDQDPVEGVPIVSNNNNLAKGSGKTTLLSNDGTLVQLCVYASVCFRSERWNLILVSLSFLSLFRIQKRKTDARTMFHEFGHAHHGMLSDATYGRLASTNVMADFVELPSQLMEHWFSERQVLEEHARHYETGEPVPMELLEKLKAAESFNEGFATIEYTICALLDMALHQVENYDDEHFDLVQFEKDELERLGMPQGIVMRHRPAHFLHLFASEMYAAGYYVYLWAETLDADAYAAFEESGDIFDKETAEKARKFIYAAGNTVAPDELFRRFRGRDPDISFMLKQKGLT